MDRDNAVGGSPDRDLGIFLDRVTQSRVRCLSCGTQRPNAAETIVSRTRDALLNHGHLYPLAPSHCPGCRALLPSIPMCSCQSNFGVFPQSAHDEKVRITWCCDDSKLFLLWSVCCGFVDHKAAELRVEPAIESDGENTIPASKGKLKKWKKLKALTSAKAAKSAASITPPAPLPQGVGYRDYYSGVPILDSDSDETVDKTPEANPSPPRSILKTSPPQQSSDEYISMMYLEALALLLESYATPSRIVTLMISRSPLLLGQATLLKHSSTDYVVRHEDLFVALLRLTEVMGRHPCTSSLFHTGYKVYPLEEQLLSFSMYGSQVMASKELSDTNKDGRSQADTVATNRTEKLSSLVECFRTLSKTAQDMLQLMSHSAGDFVPSEEGQKYARVCSLIIETVQRFATAKHDTASAVAPTKICIIAEVPDEEIISDSVFSDMAMNLQNTKPGRSRALYQQVGSLLKNLPQQNIWVRYGASRADVMKILIRGPENTPYQYGLFEFDLFCNADFPSKPPQMQLRTTGVNKAGGPVRFNPNLYESGLICLSLLGTWGNPADNKKNGEAWDEKTSTLLQLLVSLQAMIFVEEPYYNEPGIRPSAVGSEAYNADIRLHTAHYAILGWLPELIPETIANGTSPPVSHIWNDVLREHFTQEGHKILAMIEGWKALPSHRDSGTLSKVFTLHDKIKNRLATYKFISLDE